MWCFFVSMLTVRRTKRIGTAHLIRDVPSQEASDGSKTVLDHNAARVNATLLSDNGEQLIESALECQQFLDIRVGRCQSDDEQQGLCRQIVDGQALSKDSSRRDLAYHCV